MGWRQAAVVANRVIVQGPGEGMFSYSPAVGAGKLVASEGIATAGVDQFGNAYLAGDTTYYNTGGAGSLSSAIFAVNVSLNEIAFRQAATYAGPFSSTPAALAPGLWYLGNTAWLAPSGDTSGAADSALIAAQFATPDQAVVLMPGNWYVNSTITVPTGCALMGPFPTQADNFSNYGAGSLQAQGAVITPVGAFTNQAVVACTNSTGTQQGGQVLANFSIQANTTGAGSGSMCILLDGAVGAGYISGVTAIRGDAACLRIKVDATSGHVPDQWTIENCVFAGSRSGHGVLADDMADFNVINCYSHDNALDGWNIKGGQSASFIKCRAETNTGNGFHFTGFPAAGEDMTLVGCHTELNKLSGYLFDSTGFSNAGTYNLVGCRSLNDGVLAAGILAGYYDNGCKAAVLLSGCTALSSGTEPAYGAYEGSVAFGMALTGCRTQGVTAATHDDGTNTHALSNLVPVPF